MTESYQKLIKTLQSLFEMDKADLDFGIYRIMNQKRDEINRFLEQDLLPQVQQAFADYSQEGEKDLQQELAVAIEQAKNFGAPDPENTPAVLAIKEKLQNSVDIAAIENEVYSHLNTFFRRYYDKGDFISQRRYKKDTYAIPYEGEEVKLYWANQDQYYIKSSEHLRDYAFLAHGNDYKTVRIKLVEADTEKDNTKAKTGEERRFVYQGFGLTTENAESTEKKPELELHFAYVPKKGIKQEKLNAQAVEQIFAIPEQIKQQNHSESSVSSVVKMIHALAQKAPTEKNPKRTLLEKHLKAYTARNTFDYFIHKDLGGFLRRELDFYIKNEVLFLDDIDDAAFNITEQHLRKIKVLRSIAHKLIRMLAQLEDFQKKLWLKKKFVVDTQYCLTLDRIDTALHADIVACDAQWREWVSLGFLTTEDTERTENRERILKESPYLVVDTKFYSSEWKDRLIASIDNMDEQCDGLLVQSENFQALSLLQERYREKVKCIYIDPPYNTGEDGFNFKDSFKHSSWMAMAFDRLTCSFSILQNSGVFLGSIDDIEVTPFRNLIEIFVGSEGFLGNFVWKRRITSSLSQSWISTDHEYVLVYSKDANKVDILGEEKDKSKYSKDDGDGRKYASMPLTVGMNRFQRPNQWYALINPITKNEYWPPENRVWCYYPPTMEEKIIQQRIIWPDDYTNSRMTAPRLKSYDDESQRDRKPVSTWINEVNTKNDYDDVISLVSARNEEGTKWLNKLFRMAETVYPKPISLIYSMVKQFLPGKNIVLDYFAGSGTTAHAVINLNRVDNGQRKYILVEMGEYFNTVLKPRIQKVVYSKDWKDGKPKPDNDGNLNGISHCFKYLKLESYEDTLNNLLVKPHNKAQRDLLQENPDLREDYLLGYWLDVETQDSASVLNLDQFEDPFNYQLNIATGSAGATQATPVDVVETFNYLLGLTVKHIDVVRGFKVVTGVNPNDESVLVIWRNLKQQDNAAFEAFLTKSGYNPRDTEYDHIYVNGDHTLDDPHSKVKMIEIEFKRLMFDVQDV